MSDTTSLYQRIADELYIAGPVAIADDLEALTGRLDLADYWRKVWRRKAKELYNERNDLQARVSAAIVPAKTCAHRCDTCEVECGVATDHPGAKWDHDGPDVETVAKTKE